MTRYCHEVALKLKRLRDADTATTGDPWDTNPTAPPALLGTQRFPQVDYFFEIFSLQLQVEYRSQSMRTKTPAVAAHYIIFNLRNHFENLCDLGNLDDRRVPMMRQSFDTQTYFVVMLVVWC